METGYFRGPNEERYYFADIAARIRAAHPALIGRHIGEQLDALGLRDAMRRGTTPYCLPYSFSDVEQGLR